MKKFSYTAIALTVAMFTMATLPIAAQAAEEEQANYFDLMGSFAKFDRELAVNDGYAGVSGRIGRAFNERWNLELNLQSLDVKGKSDVSSSAPYEAFSLGINALSVFNRGGVFQPFLLGGLGMNDSKIGNASSNVDPYMDLGAGAFVPIFDNKVRLRGEAIYRAIGDTVDSKNWLLNVGFSIPFGKKAAAPVVLAAAPAFIDSDGDGVQDSADQCPNTPKGAKVNSVGCELDSKDKCPGTPKGTKVDADGCPIVVVINLEGVNFRTNSAELVGGAGSILDQQANTLVANKNVMIEVAGHTDASGDDSYNMGLSQRRADSVRNYLIGKGVAANRITSRGYGETQPIASNANRDDMAKNRRVELRITEK